MNWTQYCTLLMIKVVLMVSLLQIYTFFTTHCMLYYNLRDTSMPGSVKERDYLCVLRMDSELVDMGLIKIIAPHLFYWSPNKKFANIQVCTDDKLSRSFLQIFSEYTFKSSILLMNKRSFSLVLYQLSIENLIARCHFL